MRNAALLSLLCLASCFHARVTYSTDFDHVFGDRLDASPGVRLLCWPADRSGDAFRCVVDKTGAPIEEQPVTIWPERSPSAEPVGSVIVILPPDASAALRSRAEVLAGEVTRGRPNAGRHFVHADPSWQDISGGAALRKRLAALHDEARKSRERSADDGLLLSWDMIDSLAASVVVVPIEGEPDQYLVFQGIRRKPGAFFPGTTSDAESRSHLSAVEIGSLPECATTNGTVTRPTLFDIVIAESAGPAMRERVARLAADLLARPRTSVHLRQAVNPEEDPHVTYVWDFTAEKRAE